MNPLSAVHSLIQLISQYLVFPTLPWSWSYMQPAPAANDVAQDQRDEENADVSDDEDDELGEILVLDGTINQPD